MNSPILLMTSIVRDRVKALTQTVILLALTRQQLSARRRGTQIDPSTSVAPYARGVDTCPKAYSNGASDGGLRAVPE